MGIIYQVQNKKIISKIKNLFQNKVLKEFGQYLFGNKISYPFYLW